MAMQSKKNQLIKKKKFYLWFAQKLYHDYIIRSKFLRRSFNFIS